MEQIKLALDLLKTDGKHTTHQSLSSNILAINSKLSSKNEA